MPDSPTKIWKVALFFAVATSLLFGAFVVFLPRQYYVSRSIVVQASPERIHSEVADLHTWPRWAVWLKTVEGEQALRFGSTPAGASLHFAGQQFGEGSFTVEEDTATQITLRAEVGPEGGSGLHRIQLSEAQDGTRIVWSMIGHAGEGALAALTVGTREQLAVADFDKSLANLKRCIEDGCN